MTFNNPFVSDYIDLNLFGIYESLKIRFFYFL